MHSALALMSKDGYARLDYTILFEPNRGAVVRFTLYLFDLEFPR